MPVMVVMGGDNGRWCEGRATAMAGDAAMIRRWCGGRWRIE